MEPMNSPTSLDVRVGDFWRVAIERWWGLLLGILIGGGAGFLFGWRVEPEFVSTSLVQIGSPVRSTGSLEALTGVMESNAQTETEVEIAQSRSVLREVVVDLGLRNVASSVGFWRSFTHKSGRMDVGVLDIPYDPSQENSWTAVVVDDSTVMLRDPSKAVVLKAEVGETAVKAQGSDTIRLKMTYLDAEPGEVFEIFRMSGSAAITFLQNSLKVSEVGKRTDILEFTLRGSAPDRTKALLEAVTASYVRHNAETRVAEARKTLEFLQKQLPAVKGRLDSMESISNQFRYQRGIIDIGMEGRGLLDEQARLQSQILNLDQQRQDLLRLYKDDHPFVVALDARKRQLEAAVRGAQRQARVIPLTQQELEKLNRDIAINTAMYNALQNNIQQLQLAQSGESGNARVIDPPEAGRVTKMPDPFALAGAGAVMGLFAAYGLFMGIRLLRTGVRSASGLDRFGRPVIAQIPLSSEAKSSNKGKIGSHAAVLAVRKPFDPGIEALRGLRTSLDLSFAGRWQRILSVSSLGDMEGKSLVASNLAVLFAQVGRKVILLDADFRAGSLHDVFKVPKDCGLADCLAGEVSVDEIIKDSRVPGLGLVTVGRCRPNSSDMLASDRHRELVKDLSSRCDLLIVDVSALLPVADPLLTMRLSDHSLIVLKSGAHGAKRVAEGLRKLQYAGIEEFSFVLNQCEDTMARMGGGYASARREESDKS